MRKAFAIILLMLPSACAGIGTPTPLTVVGAMNAPLVLRAQRSQPAEAQAVIPPPSTVPVPRVIVRKTPETTDIPAGKWGARVDYDHTIDRPDLLAYATRNQEVSRPAFATLKRSFGTGDLRPYVGVGVGQASSKFGMIDPGTQEGYAVKGVLGSDLIFTRKFGGYVQYDYAVASSNAALAEEDKSHGISVGLKISFN